MDCKTYVHIDQVGLQQKMKIVITPLIITSFSGKS